MALSPCFSGIRFHCTFPIVPLAALLMATTGLHAQNGYEFQRAIEHRREFQRELDSYASRPNSTLGTAPGVDQQAVREWVEARQAAQNAWRAEAAANEQAKADQQAALREARRERARQLSESETRWIGRGFSAYDIGYLSQVSVSGEDRDGRRAAAEELPRRFSRFEQMLETTSDYSTLARLARHVHTGVEDGDHGRYNLAPFTAARCFERIAARWPAHKERALQEAAYFCRLAYDNRRAWSLASREARGEMVRAWLQSIPFAHDNEAPLILGRLVLEQSDQFEAPSLVPETIAMLEATAADGLLYITPARPGLAMTKGDQAAYERCRAYHVLMARYHLREGDFPAAARNYVRILDARGWTPSTADIVMVEGFFEQHPETAANLRDVEVFVLRSFEKKLVSAPLLRRLLAAETTFPPHARAVRLEQIARLSLDAQAALDAICLYKGPVWEDYAHPDELLRVTQWILNEPAARTPRNAAVLRRIESLGWALMGEGSPRALEAVRALRSAEDPPDALYAEIFLLTFGRDANDATKAAGIALIPALEKIAPDYRPWGGGTGAPIARSLRAFAQQKEDDTIEHADALIAELESLKDPWAAAFAGRLLSDSRRSTEQWQAARICLRLASQAGVRQAAADIGYLTYFGQAGFDRDPDEAKAFLLLGAEAGYENAMYALGLYYFPGSPVEDAEKSFALLRRVTGKHRAVAQGRCARLIMDGRIEGQAQEQALTYAREAADAGQVDGFFAYGELVARGLVPGVPRTDSFEWWTKARAKKHFYAARALYIAQSTGRLAAPEPQKALEEFQAYLEAQPLAVQYFGALTLLDDEDLGEKIGFKQVEAGHALLEVLIERRQADAVRYIMEKGW